jgi:cystathionine beta-lyase
MLSYDFDRVIERRNTNSIKWRKYKEDVLPLWVADMDFTAPQPILDALQKMVSHGIIGYEMPTRELCETVAMRMQKLYGWQVSPDWVVATPGVIAGFTVAAQVICTARQGILVQPPVYPPFLKVHEYGGLVRQEAPLTLKADGATLRYEIDFDAFAQAINGGGRRTGMFLLCNPQNPTGQAYSRADLSRMAEICLEKKVVICSDEIHSELLLGETRHIPIAALDAEVADRTITLISPSKTFNIPGLFCGFAIIPNKDLLERYKQMVERMGMHVSTPGLAAAQVAFSGQCADWLAALRAYLTANRDLLLERLKSDFSGIRTTVPEATYLAWLDCSELVKSGRIADGTPSEFFLEHAKVALNEGKDFGPGGEGFVRLNFGCPRAVLIEALDRMKTALDL